VLTETTHRLGRPYHENMMPLLSLLRQLGQAQKFKMLALSSLLIVGCAMGLRWWSGPLVQADTIERRDFVQTVVASGHVESPHRVELGAQLTGTVKRVPVTEGQSVQQDQVLIELESSELMASLKQAELSVVQAAAKIRQLKEVQTPTLEQAYKQALATQGTTQNALLRAQDLFAKGFTGQAALDEAQRLALIAQSQVVSLKEQVASLHEGGSDLWAAQTNLSQAQASVELAKARLRYSQVRAPVAGILISRNVEPGDVIQPGKVLMILSPGGATELVVQIDEKHLSQLKVGQIAMASADAYSAQHFDAVLSYINPGIDAQRGSVMVKLKVMQPPPYLQQDMTVSLNIETARKTQVVLVPSDAIQALEKSAWVMVVRDGKAVKQKIQIGLQGAGWSEVLSGLKPGDKVIREILHLQENERVRLP
jgi:HlyD family secretion protein